MDETWAMETMDQVSLLLDKKANKHTEKDEDGEDYSSVESGMAR